MARAQGSGSTRWNPFVFSLPHGLPAVVYLAIVYWFGSHAALEPGGGELVGRVDTLIRIPLYAGLGFFILRAISRGQALAAHRGARAAFTLVATGVVATIDEWRQAFVSGRDPSGVHLVLDLAGVAVLLLTCALGAAQEPRS